MYGKHKRPWIERTILKEQSLEESCSLTQLPVQSYSNQNSITLAQKQKHSQWDRGHADGQQAREKMFNMAESSKK